MVDTGLNKHPEDNYAHASQQKQEYGNDTALGTDRLAEYPAFESAYFNDSDIQLTANGSILPIPELSPETNSMETSQENSLVAEKASESTQLAIERMVNPSSLLSSAMEDIRQSGEGNATDPAIGANPSSSSLSPSFLGQDVRFSTIHLYGKIIQAKDFLIISGNEEAGSKMGIYVMAKIPCDDSQNTPLKFIILENWSSIAYPLPEMHLVEGVPNGELCMFRFKYPESGIEDSDIVPNEMNGSNDAIDRLSTIGVALYNSGASSIKFPKTASITLSHISGQ